MYIAREKLNRFNMEGALYIRDLPTEVKSNVRYQIGGASGELYNFTASRSHVTIYPVISDWTKLMGFINRPNEVGFHLNTRVDQNQKPTHDLHAAIFYDAFLFYLLSNSVTVNAVRDEWYSGSTNHNQYVAARSSDKSVDEAAYSTWSGCMAQSNGFKIIKPVTDMETWQEKYELLFMRS